VRARANKALAGLVAAGAGARAPAEGGSGRAAPRREDYTLLMMREDVAVRRRAVQLAARAPPGGAGLLRLQEALARRMKQDADLQVRRVAAASLAEVSPPPDAPALTMRPLDIICMTISWSVSARMRSRSRGVASRSFWNICCACLATLPFFPAAGVILTLYL